MANNKDFVVKNGLTVGTDATIGSTLYVSTVDTTDSSAITVVPSTTFNSDVTVENDLRVSNAIENTSGNTLLPAVLGNADQVLTVSTDGVNASWKSITDIFGGGIDNVVEDTTPQLGGNLDLNSQDITGTGNIDINGTIGITNTAASGLTLNVDQGNSSLSGRLFFNNGTTGKAISLFNTTNDLGIFTGATPGSSSGTRRVTIKESGRVGIGTSIPSTELEVVGSITASGSLFVPTIDTSDSSAITVVPSATFNSDVTVENTLYSAIAYIDKLGVPDALYVDLIKPRTETGLNKISIHGEVSFPEIVHASSFDTTDSSAITFQPEVDFNADVRAQNNLIVTNQVDAARFKGDGSLLTNLQISLFDLSDTNVAGQVTNTLLKYNGSKYVPTSLTENSSGDVTANSKVKINYSSTTEPALAIESTDSTSNASPELELYKNSTSADGHYLGQIKFAGENDTGGKVNYAKITGKILDNTNGTEDGILEFAFQKAGSQNISARFRSDSLQLINGTNFVVNGTTTLEDTVTVNSNIVITGTVDGRDVATDGTKLDTIESNATADQTAAEILAALITVDGAGTSLDADLLDGQQGSHYLDGSNFTGTLPNDYVTLGTMTTGNYLLDVSGTTNEIEITHTPGEGSTATIGLPNNVTIGNNLTVTTALFTPIIDTTDSSGIIVVPGVTFNADVTIENDLRVTNSIENASGSTLLPATLGTTNQVLTVNAAGNAEWSTISTGSLNNVVEDTTPQLGGNLDLNSQDITGTGNINVTGNVTVDGILLAPTIDTTDSSNITVIPGATFNSDLSVENNVTVVNSVTAAEFIGDGSALTNVQVTLGSQTTGNYMVGVTGTANEIEISHTPGEGSTATIGLPDDVTIGNNLTVTTGLFTPLIDTADSSAITITPAATFNSDVTVENDLVANGNVTASAFFGDGSNLTGISTTTTFVALTDTDVASQATDTLIKYDGTNYVATSTSEDSSGNVTITGQLNVGTIDTTDSSAISVTPAATFNSDVTVENSLIANNDVYVGHYIDFSTTVNANHAEYQEGRLWYDSIHKTFNYYSDISNVVHELGIEQHIRVYNNSGSAITKGQPLYFTGNYENGHVVPTVGLANATSALKYDAQGLAAADIANGAYGFCQLSGQLFGLDTSGLTAGQHFYVGLTDGALQNASPSYPNYPVLLGWVVKSHATDGVVNIHLEQHTMDTFRVVNDAHFGNDVIVDGDLTVNGTQTITSQANISTGSAFIYLNSGDTIGEANTTFTGSGLDDAYFSGHYDGTSTTNYYVRIDSTGTPDTFEWSKNNFSSTEATGVAITGSDQTLDQGISINFGTTTGHTSGDVWSGTAAPTNVDTGLFTNRNTGGTGVGYTHAGLFFDITDEKWKLVEEYDPSPTGTIDTSHASYNEATLSLDTLEASTGTFSTAVTVGGNNVLTTASEIALGTSTTGNYVATIAGTTNEVEVTGSGSETAAVTIGLPDDVTIGNNLTVTTALFTPTIDTTDSSAITITPAATFNSDVTVENDLVANGNVTASAFFGDGSNLTGISTTTTFEALTDTAVSSQAADTLIRYNGSAYVPASLKEDSVGRIGIGTAPTAGFSLSVGGNTSIGGQLEVSTIDTSDSSGITVVPAATFNSDVTIENDLRVTNDIENSSGETILPSTLGTAGKVLTVNSAGDGVEWTESSSTSGFTEEFPTVTNGSANVTMGDSYTLDQLIVYLNGVKLRQTSEYTVSGTTLTFAENLVTGDIVNLIVYTNAVNITGVTSLTGTANEVEVSTSTGAVTVGLPDDVTIGNNLTVTNGLIVDTDTLYVDASNNRVGIGTSSPSKKLHVYRDDTNTDAQVLIEQDGTGDASIGFLKTGVYNWMTGIDTTDNKYKISGSGAGLDTNNYLAIDTSGNVGIGTTSPSTELEVNGTIQDSQGNVRALEITTDATSSVTIASGSTGKYFRLTGSTVTININAGNFAAGDIITLHNATASDMTIDFDANFTDTVYIAGDGTDKNNSTITLAGYGLATCIAFTSAGMIVNGNVS